jgi:CBS domain-containing protein/ribosome-associated translation inhibitor RaiA
MVVAQDILNSEVVKKDGNDSFSQVINLFHDTDAIVVTDQNTYQGMLLKRTLMEPKVTMQTKLHTMLTHTPKLSLNTPIEEIARVMVENHVYHLPVLDKNKVVGLVSADTVIQKLTEQDLGTQPVKTIMSTQPHAISPEETIGKALHLFQHENISYLAVVDHNTVVGAITLDTMVNNVVHHPGTLEGRDNFESERRQKLDQPAKTIMQEQPLLLSPKTSIRDVHTKMHAFELPGMLIGKDNRLHGMVTHKELLAPYAGFDQEDTIAIQFHHNNLKVEGFDKEEAAGILREEFLKNYKKFLVVGYLHVTLEQHKETKQGLHRVVCEMKLSGKPGVYYATSEGYGPHQAMRNAFLAIEHQINKVKRT